MIHFLTASVAPGEKYLREEMALAGSSSWWSALRIGEPGGHAASERYPARLKRSVILTDDISSPPQDFEKQMLATVVLCTFFG